MLKRIFLVIAGLFLIPAIFTSPSLVSAAPNVAPTNADFQVVIAAPLTTNVDVYVDGVITSASGLKAVKPLNASGFIVVAPGTHTVTIAPTGTTTQVGPSDVFSFAPGPNSRTSLVLLSNMTWLTIPDNDTPPAPGMVSARVVNVSSDASTSTVNVTVDSATPSTFSGVSYQGTSPYLSFTGGAHTFSIPNSPALPVTKTLASGSVYAIFVFWNASAPQLVVFPEASYRINVYLPMIIH